MVSVALMSPEVYLLSYRESGTCQTRNGRQCAARQWLNQSRLDHEVQRLRLTLRSALFTKSFGVFENLRDKFGR